MQWCRKCTQVSRKSSVDSFRASFEIMYINSLYIMPKGCLLFYTQQCDQFRDIRTGNRKIVMWYRSESSLAWYDISWIGWIHLTYNVEIKILKFSVLKIKKLTHELLCFLKDGAGRSDSGGCGLCSPSFWYPASCSLPSGTLEECPALSGAASHRYHHLTSSVSSSAGERLSTEFWRTVKECFFFYHHFYISHQNILSLPITFPVDRCLLVLNKTDLLPEEQRQSLDRELRRISGLPPVCLLSCHTNEGLHDFLTVLHSSVQTLWVPVTFYSTKEMIYGKDCPMIVSWGSVMIS